MSAQQETMLSVTSSSTRRSTHIHSALSRISTTSNVANTSQQPSSTRRRSKRKAGEPANYVSSRQANLHNTVKKVNVETIGNDGENVNSEDETDSEDETQTEDSSDDNSNGQRHGLSTSLEHLNTETTAITVHNHPTINTLSFAEEVLLELNPYERLSIGQSKAAAIVLDRYISRYQPATQAPSTERSVMQLKQYLSKPDDLSNLSQLAWNRGLSVREAVILFGSVYLICKQRFVELNRMAHNAETNTGTQCDICKRLLARDRRMLWSIYHLCI